MGYYFSHPRLPTLLPSLIQDIEFAQSTTICCPLPATLTAIQDGMKPRRY